MRKRYLGVGRVYRTLDDLEAGLEPRVELLLLDNLNAETFPDRLGNGGAVKLNGAHGYGRRGQVPSLSEER